MTISPHNTYMQLFLNPHDGDDHMCDIGQWVELGGDSSHRCPDLVSASYATPVLLIINPNFSCCHHHNHHHPDHYYYHQLQRQWKLIQDNKDRQLPIPRLSLHHQPSGVIKDLNISSSSMTTKTMTTTAKSTTTKTMTTTAKSSTTETTLTHYPEMLRPENVKTRATKINSVLRIKSRYMLRNSCDLWCDEPYETLICEVCGKYVHPARCN